MHDGWKTEGDGRLISYVEFLRGDEDIQSIYPSLYTSPSASYLLTHRLSIAQERRLPIHSSLAHTTITSAKHPKP
jgi:hypothetical protein